MIKSQLIYAHLVINQGSHNHISQKNFCPSKEITQSGEGNSNAINVIKDDQCENFLFLQKKNGFARIQRIHSTEKLFKCVWCDKSFHKKKLLSHIRKHILGRSHLNVINVIKVFSENIAY